MKQAYILLLLVLKNCDADKVVKRFVNEQNITSANTSFQVNVSAGYGVHPENSTVTTVFPVYRFQERKTQDENLTELKIRNYQDQNSQPSQSIPEVLPSASYQVHEKTPEVQEKNFQVAKHHRHRSVEKRIRSRPNEMRKPVEAKETTMRHEPLTAGTKIVEVLRVPAMYELHLQSDPQRLASLNTAWLTKLMNQNLNKRLVSQPFNQFSGAKNLYQQPQNLGLNFIQGAASTNHQRLSNIFQTPKFRFPQKSISIQPSNSYPSSSKVNSHQVPQIQNHGNYRQNYVRSQNYQNSYQKDPQQSQNQHSHQNTLVTAESTLKKHVELTTTQSPLSYPHLSNEISSDFYQKPQALHEVPAPVLDKQSHKFGTPSIGKIQPTSVPNLVYGKPAEAAYQTTTQSSIQVPSWGNLQEHNALNSFHNNVNGVHINNMNGYHNNQNNPPNYQYDKGQTGSISTYFQQPLTDSFNSVSQQNVLGGYPQHHGLQYQNQGHPQYQHQGPSYHNQNFVNSLQNYKGHKSVQNYYNDAIGDYLDQNLANVNGDVATYMNNDGSLTVSNFHHNPKLYRPPPGYEIPVTEEANMEDANHEFGTMPYAGQDQDLTSYNHIYSGINNDEPLSENNQIETGENQDYNLQNNADLSQMLLATARSGVEEVPVQKYESMNGHGRTYMAKRIMFPKRRTEPMDYILYIKERRFD